MKQFGFMLAALAILMLAAFTLILAPSIQMMKQEPEKHLKPYSADELRGREVYVSNGCVYCHSQQPRDPEFGVDQKRNWGRPSTPGDYAYDSPHLLGTMRTGPDLLNIGVRQPSETWHLLHLFQPRAVVPDSIMPSYRFLFVEKSVVASGDVIVNVPAQFKSRTGTVIVASINAINLVKYLKSLDRNYPPTQRPFEERRHVSGK